MNKIVQQAPNKPEVNWPQWDKEEFTYDEIYGDCINNIKGIKSFYIGVIEKTKNVLSYVKEQVLEKITIKRNEKERKRQLSVLQKKTDSLMESIVYLDNQIKQKTNGILVGLNFVLFSTDPESIPCFDSMGFSIEDHYSEETLNLKIPMIEQCVLFDLIQLFTQLTISYIDIMHHLNDVEDFIYPDRLAEHNRFLEKQIKELKSMQLKGNKMSQKIQKALERHENRTRKSFKKIENQVQKRNEEDNQTSLSQTECAGIFYKHVGFFNKERNNYIIRNHLKDIKLFGEPNLKSLIRRIQRWDSYIIRDGKPNPPFGYNRRLSRKEFSDWAEEYEREKYIKWETRHPVFIRFRSKDEIKS